MERRGHRERKGSSTRRRKGLGKPREKRTARLAAKTSSFDLPTRRSLVTGGGMWGSLCDEWELRNGGK